MCSNQEPGTIPAVQQLLWETALRIEDGRTTTSQNDLRQAMQRLQDALARNAPDAEIDRLMRELQDGDRPLSPGAGAANAAQRGTRRCRRSIPRTC